MSEEERQRQMDFIVAQQAQFTVNMELMREQISGQGKNIDSLREAQARTDAIVAQLAQQVSLIATQQVHINEVVAVIADAQQHTDERLNALIDIVHEGRNGKL